MLKSSIKRILAVVVLVAILVPYMTNVALAIDAITPTTSTVQLTTVQMREGGDEETGTLPAADRAEYDETIYMYKMAEMIIQKIIQDGTPIDYEDTIYCLDAEKSFPTTPALTFNNKGDFFDLSISDVNAFKSSIGESNYNAVCWLVKNAYLRHVDPNFKDTIIAKAFESEIADTSYVVPNTINTYKKLITDDDFDVIWQWAIWYFTNKDRTVSGTTTVDFYKQMQVMTVTSLDGTIVDQQLAVARRDAITKLYNWLLTSAQSNIKFGYNVTYPQVQVTNSDITVSVENGMHKVGPFKVKSGTADSTQYVLRLTDGTNEIARSKYDIKIEGESSYTSQNVNQIFDKNYYIYVPLNSDITRINLEFSYTSTETKANLFKTDSSDYQPVVVITRTTAPVNVNVFADLPGVKIDLALQKFITKLNGVDVTPSREPQVNVSPLKDTTTTKTDAIYTKSSSSITVSKGDIITYKIRVYNEGSIAGYASEIADYIPNGLGLLTNYKNNSGWTLDNSTTEQLGKLSTIDGAVEKATNAGITTSDLDGVSNIGDMMIYVAKDKYGKILTDALNKANAPRALQPFNTATGTALDYQDVEVTCVVVADTTTSIYKNVAEINNNTDELGNPIGDRDSTPGSVNPLNYPEGEKRPDNTYQDDNDYESVILEQKRADLAVKKYITKVNDVEIKRSNNTKSNSPKVDATPLISGEKNASYYAEKSPVQVSKGDKIVFDIRVYNEGQVPGAASEITDYLPEGLTLTENSAINTQYKWHASTNGRVATTDYLASINIPAFDSTTNTITSSLVKIECTVTGNLAAGKILTNLVEITADNIDDDDSSPHSIDITTIDTETYTGDKNNKPDLTDKDYDYKGLEDDDDFEKLVIRGGIFDLSLKKFVTKINDKAVTPSREPVVDVSPLKAGQNNAKYTQNNQSLTVEQGDVVIYTIRVYNEGTKDGYAEEVCDYLPDGLGLLLNHQINFDNNWSIPSNATTIDLKTIEGYKKNLKASDFTGTTSLDEVQVAVGDKIKLTSNKLKSNSVDTKNLIHAFDRENGTTLDYKDIQVACIVLSNSITKSYMNISEIIKESDENRDEVREEVDSTPDSVDPRDYPGDDYTQDDHDSEILTTVKETLDLALQKFATSLNDVTITDRIPTISMNSDGTIRYSHSSTPLSVTNGDVVIFTLRVYNEGKIAGYASEVEDYLPNGLEFIKDNETNKKYGWVMYDKNDKETSDLAQAVKVKTRYLSKEEGDKRGDITLIPAIDPSKTKSDGTLVPSYRDVQIAFRVVEASLTKQTERTVKNIAEIAEERDQDNELHDDFDSIPDNNNELGKEDDLDQDIVKIKYFDLSLKKNLVKIIITEDGKTREINPSNPNDLLKVEVNRKKISSTTVKFVYDIVVTNEGEIAGYAKEVADYIPDGLKFNLADNKVWTQKGDKLIITDALADTLLEPGKSAKVQVTLEWEKSEKNLGTFKNVAEIYSDYNDSGSKDIDSTPGNKVISEDDLDDAPVIVSISTGSEQRFILLPTLVIAIMVTGITLIKKYVL